jgi:hypothetical protein
MTAEPAIGDVGSDLPGFNRTILVRAEKSALTKQGGNNEKYD